MTPKERADFKMNKLMAEFVRTDREAIDAFLRSDAPVDRTHQWMYRQAIKAMTEAERLKDKLAELKGEVTR